MLWKEVERHLIAERIFMVDNISDALKMLISENATERFTAAKYFIKNRTPSAHSALVKQRRNELVRHVRLALDKAIFNISASEQINTDVDDVTDKVRIRFLKSEAIDEFSGTILHEISPKIGLLKVYLPGEMYDYENSESKKVIDSLQRTFNAIETLRRTAAKPEAHEFDLAQLIKDILAEENKYKVNEITEGVQPCIIKSDKNILSLALANGIRNAIESICMHSGTENDLTICWGASVEENWVSIIDTGMGLADTAEAAFKIGNTNKQNHTGFGMAIIQQAVETLGGIVSLSNIDSGGAKLDLRWGNF